MTTSIISDKNHVPQMIPLYKIATTHLLRQAGLAHVHLIESPNWEDLLTHTHPDPGTLCPWYTSPEYTLQRVPQ